MAKKDEKKARIALLKARLAEHDKELKTRGRLKYGEMVLARMRAELEELTGKKESENGEGKPKAGKTKTGRAKRGK